VSSPGIDRPLTRAGDFGKWAGHEVKIELGTPTAAGRKRFHGFIEGETKDGVTVSLKDGGAATLDVADMVKAHLVLTEKLIRTRKRGGQPRPLKTTKLTAISTMSKSTKTGQRRRPGRRKRI
jgi:ribosome maturation factor RimP